jgi:hypothetical protein
MSGLWPTVCRVSFQPAWVFQGACSLSLRSDRPVRSAGSSCLLRWVTNDSMSSQEQSTLCGFPLTSSGICLNSRRSFLCVLPVALSANLQLWLEQFGITHTPDFGKLECELVLVQRYRRARVNSPGLGDRNAA